MRACVCVDGLDSFGCIVEGNFGKEFLEIYERGDEVGVNRVVEEVMRDPATPTGKRVSPLFSFAPCLQLTQFSSGTSNKEPGPSKPPLTLILSVKPWR